MHYGLGVDLGTTSVAAAVSRRGYSEMVLLGDRSVIAPAVVYRHEDGTVVTGDAASRWGLSSPGRFGRDIARRLGDPAPVILGGEPHAVTDLLGAILRDVVRKAGDAQGALPDRIVVTRPTGWGALHRRLFDQVAMKAGIPGAIAVTTPEAAATHYSSSRHLGNSALVAVYDLGGGTFDAAVVRTGPQRAEILGTPEGVERLGGIDFDDSILSFVNYRSGGALSELNVQDPQTAVVLARLRQDCMLAKEALSVDDCASVPVHLPGRSLDVRLTRADFEQMLRAPVESTISALLRALRSAQVSPHELSAIVMVGGSSRIPLVSRMVAGALRGPALVNLHPDHTVALGAAELAARMLGSGRQGSTATPANLVPPTEGGAPPHRRPAAAAPGRLFPPAQGPARADGPWAQLPPPGPYPPGPGTPSIRPAPADADGPTVADPPPGEDWQAPSIGRLLVLGTGLLALAVVVGLVAYAVISRL